MSARDQSTHGAEAPSARAPSEGAPSGGEPSDGDLVGRANAGDRAAFAALYERHRDYVHGLAWRLTGDADLAADVVQETFLWWLTRFPGFELTAKVTTFLHPVTRSIAVDRMRRRGRQPRSLDDGEEPATGPAGASAAVCVPGRSGPTGEGPGEAQASKDAHGDLAAAIASLTPAAQEVLILRHVHDLSLAEIAEALGVPLGTVKSRLHAATEALRRTVEGRNRPAG